jgi:hypothetical protein
MLRLFIRAKKIVAQKLSLIFANASFVSKRVKVLVKMFDFLKFF